MAKQKWSFYRGTIINPKNDAQCEFYPKGLLVVKNGLIHDVLALTKGLKKYRKHMTEVNTRDFGQSAILPGFFDMHFHWVQDDVREMPKDSLLQWLDHHTFPAEMKFADPTYAEQKAKDFFPKLLKTGTVGGACYSSIHEVALDAAMKHVRGDFVIGNVLMNINSPPALTQSDQDALSFVRRSIKKYGKRYAFTPRFAIATSAKVMKEGSRIADRSKCFKQSHLSETPAEIDFVKSIYRDLKGFEKATYTEIYHRVGMLGPRSLMGHGIHLSDEELALLKKTRTALVHCPTSNAPVEERGLGSGLFDFKKVEKAKVRWALGSDIGGGPYLSMFDVMGSFVEQNRRAGVKGATYVKALYRATLAGAEILRLNRAGNLSKGKRANFIVAPCPSGAKTAEELLQGVIEPYRSHRQGYDHLIQTVVLDGERIP